LINHALAVLIYECEKWIGHGEFHQQTQLFTEFGGWPRSHDYVVKRSAMMFKTEHAFVGSSTINSTSAASEMPHDSMRRPPFGIHDEVLTWKD
jgi:hypothetical protein